MGSSSKRDSTTSLKRSSSKRSSKRLSWRNRIEDDPGVILREEGAISLEQARSTRYYSKKWKKFFHELLGFRSANTRYEVYHNYPVGLKRAKKVGSLCAFLVLALIVFPTDMIVVERKKVYEELDVIPHLDENPHTLEQQLLNQIAFLKILLGAVSGFLLTGLAMVAWASVNGMHSMEMILKTAGQGFRRGGIVIGGTQLLFAGGAVLGMTFGYLSTSRPSAILDMMPKKKRRMMVTQMDTVQRLFRGYSHFFGSLVLAGLIHWAIVRFYVELYRRKMRKLKRRADEILALGTEVFKAQDKMIDNLEGLKLAWESYPPREDTTTLYNDIIKINCAGKKGFFVGDCAHGVPNGMGLLYMPDLNVLGFGFLKGDKPYGDWLCHSMNQFSTVELENYESRLMDADEAIWQYRELDEFKYRPLDKKVSKQLEKEFLARRRSGKKKLDEKIVLVNGGNTLEVDLQNWRANAFGNQYRVKRCSPFEPTLPFWDPMEQETRFIDVEGGSKEFQHVQSIVDKGFRVLEVKRIQNKLLLRRFLAEQENFQESGVPSEPKILYHGTRLTKPETIAESFDGLLSGVNDDNFYGRGCYFAERLQYANHYAHFVSRNRRQVLLVQVLTGHSKRYEAIQLQLEKRRQRASVLGNRYQSVLGGPHRPHRSGPGMDDSLMYVVYEGRQTLPIYIVTFEPEEEFTCNRCLDNYNFANLAEAFDYFNVIDPAKQPQTTNTSSTTSK